MSDDALAARSTDFASRGAHSDALLRRMQVALCSLVVMSLAGLAYALHGLEPLGCQCSRLFARGLFTIICHPGRLLVGHSCAGWGVLDVVTSLPGR